MTEFKGFSDSESFTKLPDSFFGQLLSEITDVDELKVTLLALRTLDGGVRALRDRDLGNQVLGLTAPQIRAGLQKTLKRGTLLLAANGTEHLYFLNTPRGRASSQAFARGEWLDASDVMPAPPARSNVFKIYEENIGPLTPLIAEALQEAEAIYAQGWISDAIELAVTNNKRSWKYCEAILKRWKEEGRGQKQNRRDHKGSRQRDVEDKIKKFVGG